MRVSLIFLAIGTAVARAQMLADFEKPRDRPELATTDARTRYVTRNGNTVLHVETGHKQTWPGVTLKAGDRPWNLSSAGYLRADVRNAGENTITVNCRVDNPGADGKKHCTTGSLRLPAGQAGTLLVPLTRPVFERGKIKLFGMRGSPFHEPILDLANITQVLFFLHRPREEHAFEIDAMAGCGGVDPFHPPDDPERFFPCIDRLGQYAHSDWPGKTKSLRDLRDAGDAEQRDLAAHPPSKNVNGFGGWADGPRLEATGFFRVEKRNNVWWLVDPEGRLFWSHGVDCVHEHAATPITDREHWYVELPAPETPLARFFGRGSWAPHGYYHDHLPYRTFDFFRANLVHKYGRDWKKQFSRCTTTRLRSWGLNTIGNWSSLELCRERQVPYVRGVHVDAVKLEGSEGYWGKFPDVFDTRFRQAAGSCFRSLHKEIGDDPWCIGFFVDNELTWGKVIDLPLAVLRSPPGQAAKKAFVSWLKKKHTSIDRLNQVWHTEHATWDAFLACREPPAPAHARDDLTDFSLCMARQYFQAIREALKSEFPHHLYLGCRFSVTHDVAAQAAAESCDVVSYNLYSYDIASFRLPGRTRSARPRGRVSLRCPGPRHVPHGSETDGRPGAPRGTLWKLCARRVAKSADRGHALVPVQGPGCHGPGRRRELPDRVRGRMRSPVPGARGCGTLDRRRTLPDTVRSRARARRYEEAFSEGVDRFAGHGLSTPNWTARPHDANLTGAKPTRDGTGGGGRTRVRLYGRTT